jgi:hypothetical protein
MPVLTAYPSSWTAVGNAWTQSAGYLYADDTYQGGGQFPEVLGMAASTYTNEVISGDITFNSATELGLFARGSQATGNVYILSLDPTSSPQASINFTKVIGLTDWVNLGDMPAVLPGGSAIVGNTYGLSLEVVNEGANVLLVGKLFDGSGNLLQTTQCLDNGLGGVAAYQSGLIGTFGFERGGPIQGTWTNLAENQYVAPEPGTIAILAAGALALLGWAGLRRYTR